MENRELIAPYEMVYRNKINQEFFGKHIVLGIGDTEYNWELIYEIDLEK